MILIGGFFITNDFTFTHHSYTNRQNCRYWSRENPNWMRKEYMQ